MKILIVVIFIYHAVTNNGRGTAQERRASIAENPSDIDTLLNKLITIAEGMKTQIVCEVANRLAKQSEEMKTLASETLYSQNLIMDQIKEIDSSVANFSGNLDAVKDCCDGEVDAIEINQHLLEDISTSVTNITGVTFENVSFQMPPKNFSIVFPGKPQIPPTIYTDCPEVRRFGQPTGPYRIRVDERVIDAYCDFDTPGGDWLVIQRRRNGSVDFFRKWDEYTKGFGKVTGEFWLGNEILYLLTSKQKYKMRVDLQTFTGQKRFAEYSPFSVGPSSDYYRLNIGNYSGNAGDSLTPHNNMQFTTYDADHDAWLPGNCAMAFHGAWWYAACQYSNLNGRFYRGKYTFRYGDGVTWYHWLLYTNSLKSEMKIAPWLL